MYQRGIINILIIVIGLVIVAILIGIFTTSKTTDNQVSYNISTL